MCDELNVKFQSVFTMEVLVLPAREGGEARGNTEVSRPGGAGPAQDHGLDGVSPGAFKQ